MIGSFILGLHELKATGFCGNTAETSKWAASTLVYIEKDQLNVAGPVEVKTGKYRRASGGLCFGRPVYDGVLSPSSRRSEQHIPRRCEKPGWSLVGGLVRHFGTFRGYSSQNGASVRQLENSLHAALEIE